VKLIDDGELGENATIDDLPDNIVIDLEKEDEKDLDEEEKL
jgi:hypothetical protein